MTRNIYVLLLSLGFISATAQMPMTSTIRTPYGNVGYSYQVPLPRTYGNYRSSSVEFTSKYQLTITLKNDSTFKCSSRIFFTKEKHFIAIKNGGNEREFFPGDTKSITRVAQNVGQNFQGVSADSCWLFKTYSGKVNCYSYIPEVHLSDIIAIQTEDGPILSLTKENLSSMIATDDPQIIKLIDKGKLPQAIMRYNQK